MDNLKDEKTLLALILSLIGGWLLLAFVTIPMTWIHESLHILATLILGGNVKEVVFFNFNAWIGNFIFPFDINTFGYVVAQFTEGTNLLLYYMMPYLILFPLAIIMAFASFIDDSYDPLMLLAGPIFYMQYIFFWGDLGGLLGRELHPPLTLTVSILFISMAMISYKLFMMLRRELNLERIRELPKSY